MSVLGELERWYESHCDGDWEHSFGVVIRTLDNPGWMVKVNLLDTELEDVPFPELNDIEPERDWIVCKVEGQQFVGAGGPNQLERICRTFLNWAHEHEAG